MINNVLCSVGTSILDKLFKIKDEKCALNGIKNKRINNLDLEPKKWNDEDWEKIGKGFLGNSETKDKNTLLHKFNELTNKEEDDILGAEINTIYSLKKEKKINPQKLYLIVSDTIRGKLSGYILKAYYEHKIENCKHKTSFDTFEIHPVPGLNVKNGKDKFENALKQELYITVDNILKKYERLKDIVIVSSGGYKPETHIIASLGHEYHIPVYYKHEELEDIIEIEPLLSIDDFIKYYHLLEAVKDNNKNNKYENHKYEITQELQKDDSKLKKWIENDKLTPSGLVSFNTFLKRVRDDIIPNSLNRKRSNKSQITYENDIDSKKIESIINKIAEEEYINSIHVKFYCNPINSLISFEPDGNKIICKLQFENKVYCLDINISVKTNLAYIALKDKFTEATFYKELHFTFFRELQKVDSIFHASSPNNQDLIDIISTLKKIPNKNCSIIQQLDATANNLSSIENESKKYKIQISKSNLETIIEPKYQNNMQIREFTDYKIYWLYETFKVMLNNIFHNAVTKNKRKNKISSIIGQSSNNYNYLEIFQEVTQKENVEKLVNLDLKKLVKQSEDWKALKETMTEFSHFFLESISTGNSYKIIDVNRDETLDKKDILEYLPHRNGNGIFGYIESLNNDLNGKKMQKLNTQNLIISIFIFYNIF